MEKSRYIGLRLPPDLYRAVQHAARYSRKTQADWLRCAISEAVDRGNQLAAIESLMNASEHRIVEMVRKQLESVIQSLEFEEGPRS